MRANDIEKREQVDFLAFPNGPALEYGLTLKVVSVDRLFPSRYVDKAVRVDVTRYANRTAIGVPVIANH
jgi:hypothetical protein